LHVLHVRAFDAVDNPSVVELPFVARDASSSFKIYQVGTFPNPMHDHTTFRFMQPAGEGAPVGVRISLFTTDGRRVRDIEVGTSTSSEIITTWDGRDSQGAILANGAYLYQIVTASINTGATSHYQGRIIIQR
jgi:FlgD Ig-like domain